MTVTITTDHLAKILPSNHNPAKWVPICNLYLPMYNIATVNNVAMFLAQTGHESLDYTVTVENLNYSAEGLQNTFKKYFPTSAAAKSYARQPEKIANRVYANRMGNGPESSGDGWKYRGKGLIQITGKGNHQEFATYKNVEMDYICDYLFTDVGAFESACWFWTRRGVAPVAEIGDVRSCTRIINGGLNGYDDRLARYNRARQVLLAPADAKIRTVLKNGSVGEQVKQIQAKLGLSADGVFGLLTEAALKKWQAENGLKNDGVAGIETLKKLFP